MNIYWVIHFESSVNLKLTYCEVLRQLLILAGTSIAFSIQMIDCPTTNFNLKDQGGILEVWL